MFCTKCGAKIADGSKFCPYCGFDGINEQAAAQPTAQKSNSRTAAPASQSPAPKPARKEKKPRMTIISAEPRETPNDSKWWIWLIVFLVCAALLAGIFLYGTNYIDYGDLDSLCAGSIRLREELAATTTFPVSM